MGSERDLSVLELLLLWASVHHSAREMSVNEFMSKFLSASTKHLMDSGREIVPGLFSELQRIGSEESLGDEHKFWERFSDSEIEALKGVFGDWAGPQPPEKTMLNQAQ